MSKIRWFWTHEPAMAVALCGVAVTLLVRIGVHMDAATLAGIIAGCLGLGGVTRQFVYSPATHDAEVAKALATPPPKGNLLPPQGVNRT